MYFGEKFGVRDGDVLAEMMRKYPLACVVTNGPAGIESAHLPLLYFPAEQVLRGHMARANRQWERVGDGIEVLAIFNGPQHYISPSWYPAKAEHGRVVPTWNYVAIHAHGRLRIHTDAAWLLENVSALTDAHEAAMEQPWKVTDAPAKYIDGMLRAIVGVEIELTRLEGKWKVSQNRSPEDRNGVAAGLAKLASPEALAMRDLILTTTKDS